MKRSILFCSTFALLSLAATARERSESEMLTIARTALSHTATRAAGLDIKAVYATPALKVYAADGAGFVVVSSDDEYPAVLGESSSDFDEAKMPCGFRFWMENVSANMAAGCTRTSYAPSLATKPTLVSNFVKTQWGQDEPYNYKVPTSNGQLTASGCVATAMAQIFNYYKYPEKANGAGGYYYSVTVKGETTTKSNKLWFTSPYKWNQMKNSYTGQEGEKDPSVVAVDELMRDCGYAVHMNYNPNGSGASSMDVPYAAAINFRYDSLSIGYMSRSLYSDEEWFDAIYSELGAKNPVFYAAVDKEQGGHAFVFSGMRTDGTVYVNWGWNGAYDGYFNIELLRPEPEGSAGAFLYSHHMVVGFRPQQAHPSGQRQKFAHSLFLLENFDVSSQDGELTVSGVFYNYDWRSFSGYLYFSLQDVNDDDNSYDIFMLTPEDKEEIGSLYGFSISKNNPLRYQEEFENDIKPGTYYLSVRSLAPDEDNIQLARTDGGAAVWKVRIDNKCKVTSIERLPHDEALATHIDAPATEMAAKSFATGCYNVAGQTVGSNARGVVVKDGKKYLVR